MFCQSRRHQTLGNVLESFSACKLRPSPPNKLTSDLDVFLARRIEYAGNFSSSHPGRRQRPKEVQNKQLVEPRVPSMMVLGRGLAAGGTQTTNRAAQSMPRRQGGMGGGGGEGGTHG